MLKQLLVFCQQTGLSVWRGSVKCSAPNQAKQWASSVMCVQFLQDRQGFDVAIFDSDKKRPYDKRSVLRAFSDS